MRSLLVFALTTSCILSSCTKDKITKESYIYYSLNGATCNGEFTIKDDHDPLTLNFSAVIAPASGDAPETVIMTFTDYTANRVVSMYLPAKKEGPFLMTTDSDFGLGIEDGENNWLLTSGFENSAEGVSMDITKFKRGTGFLGFGSVNEMEGNFEGIMTYKNEMNEVEMHTIKGDFFFNGTM
jgi:hypothetical protein